MSFFILLINYLLFDIIGGFTDIHSIPATFFLTASIPFLSLYLPHLPHNTRLENGG